MNALFTFTIGPVKPFVENGRKMSDLHAGSQILSQLTNQAIAYLCSEEVKEKLKEEALKVVFPDLQKDNMKEDAKASAAEDFNAPNRLVAKITNYNEAKALALANALEARVREHFREQYKNALKIFFGEIPNMERLEASKPKFRRLKVSKQKVSKLNNRKIKNKKIKRHELCMAARAQLDYFLEIYWAFEEYDTDYADAYQRIFAKLQAVKGIRAFAQTKEPWGRKCSLHPMYNAIFVRKTEKGKLPYNSNPKCVAVYTKEDQSSSGNANSLQYMLKPGEALSAIALFKRLYYFDKSEQNDAMHSPRYIVLENWLRLSHHEEYLQEYFLKERSSLKRSYIADSLYELYNGAEPDPEEYLQDQIVKAKKLYELVRQQEKSRLSNYYAFIKFDGDSMGLKYRELQKEEEHQRLSRNICDFAVLARKRMKENNGQCIYAGGEDVLGYLPLESLWKTLRSLHEAFAVTLKREIENEGISFTFSAGIVIAHLMQPLKDVIRQADEAERLAKETEGKNAFAVTVMKRSGETRKLVHKFGAQGVLDIIDHMSAKLANQEYSKSLIHDCYAVLDKLAAMPEPDMFDALMRQIVTQKLSGQSSRKEAKPADKPLGDETIKEQAMTDKEPADKMSEQTLTDKEPADRMSGQTLMDKEPADQMSEQAVKDKNLAAEKALDQTSKEKLSADQALLEGILEDMKTIYKQSADLQAFLNTLDIIGFLAREVYTNDI